MLSEKRHHLPKTDRLDILCNLIAVGAGSDDKGPLGLNIFKGVSKTLAESGAEATLDFNSPRTTTSGKFKHQVNLRARRGAVKAGFGCRRHRGKEIFYHKAFPARTDYRMTGKGIMICYA